MERVSSMGERADLGDRDDFNFDLGGAREGGNLDGRTGWERGGEVSLVDGVHFCEFSEIDHEDGCFDDLTEVHVVRAENGADVFQNADGLFGDAALDEVSCDRVEGDLAGAVESISNGDGLGIGAYRCRGFGGGYHFSHRNRPDYPSRALCKDVGAIRRVCKNWRRCSKRRVAR